MKSNSNRGILFFSVFLRCALFVFLLADFVVAGQKMTLKLKSQVIVVGPNVKLTEICTILPNDAALLRRLDKIILGRAAPPGESKEISRSLIKMNLRRTGMYDRLGAITGPRTVRVKTAQKDITRVKIEDAVAQFIGSKMPDRAVEWRFDYSRIAEKIAGPVHPFEFKIRLQNSRLNKGHTTFEVRIMADGKTVTRTKVSGILRTFENVAIAAKELSRGQVLQPGDMLTKKMETTYLAGDPLLTLGGEKPLESRVRIPAGKIITRKMIMASPAVRKGERVVLEIVAGNVALRTRALSQQNGALHENIRVWMQDTRKILKGEIIAKGLVRVEL